MSMDRFPQTFAMLQTKTIILRPEADEVARFDMIRSVAENHPNASLINLQSVPGMHHNAFTESVDSMRQVTQLSLDWVRSLP